MGPEANIDFLTSNGLQLVVLLQSLPWLEAPARFFTLLGSGDFFLLLLPVLYWCIDAGLGIRVGFILLFANAFTEMAKLALCSPRPYWVSAQVKPLAAEVTFGAPSGHSLMATGVWGTLAAHLHRTWAWIAAGVLIFLIGLSRMILGVHFPHDVLLGWLLGGITLWAFVLLWERISARIKRMSLVGQVLLAAAVPAVMLLIHGSLVFALRSYVLPAEWMANAARAGEPLPAPVSMVNAVTSAGTLLGLGIGLAWLGQRGGFRPSGPVWKRALCFLVGMLGVLVLYIGLKPVLSSNDAILGAILRLLRYALIGVWVSAGAPFAFVRLGLVAGRRSG